MNLQRYPQLLVIAFTLGLHSEVLAADSPTPISGPASLSLPEVLFNYAAPDLPEYFETQNVRNYHNSPASMPVTDAGATLGRVLFYDRQLSLNQTLSCASCHVQKNAFADPRPLSVGFDGKLTDRNSLALNDIAYGRSGFFWDERTSSLEESVLIPIFSHVEMGLTESLLIERLHSNDVYEKLFNDAFQSSKITKEGVAKALAQFLRSMVSTNSRYDQAIADSVSSQVAFPSFSVSENLGKEIFFEKCASCHTLTTGPKTAVFAMFRSLNNGSDFNADVRDGGRGDAVFNPSEIGAFKASSLRNVELTAPYFHDGRFATLEEVIEFYSSGVNRHPNIGPVTRFQFSEAEKKGLIDFLKTLTDADTLNHERFSDPWSPVTPLPQPLNDSQTDILLLDRRMNDSLKNQVRDSDSGIVAMSEEETLDWLKKLDLNQDGLLSGDELAPIVQVLQATGALTPVSRTRAAAARAGVRASDGPSSVIVTPRLASDAPARTNPQTEIDQTRGDFDGDGIVTADEAAKLSAFERLMHFGGGGRDEVFYDRFLARFDVPLPLKEQARLSLRSSKSELEKLIKAEDLKTSNELQALFGAELFQSFQNSVVFRQTEIPVLNTDPQIRERINAFLMQSDLNRDQHLDESELEHLARELSKVPGGFGQLRHSAPELKGFVERLMKFDQDGDQCISVDELPERIQHFVKLGDKNQDGKLDQHEAHASLTQAAYERYLEAGIYIGGAFANTLSVSLPSLNDLKLYESQKSQATEILQRHQRIVQKLGHQASGQEFEKLQTILYPSPASP